jgi:dihydroorotate dehydrogenase electron transfer subunit
MTTSTQHRGVFLAEVLLNEAICDEHFRMILDLPAFPTTRPGQFVQVMCRPVIASTQPRELEWSERDWPRLTGTELTGETPLLRRPISLAGRRNHAAGRVELDLIYRVVGRGTRWLSTVMPGTTISVLGPLGNAFTVFPDRPNAAVIGGGVGIPPMLYLSEALNAAGKQTVAFTGARTSSMLPLRLLPSGTVDTSGLPTHSIAEFAAFGVDTAIATDDGSLGLHGTVADSFDAWLANSGVAPDSLAVYTCGPEGMMRAIADRCVTRGIACEVSLERTMACGMGTCQSCVCKTKADTDAGWTYKLCCTDGPVFSGEQVIWS